MKWLAIILAMLSPAGCEYRRHDHLTGPYERVAIDTEESSRIVHRLDGGASIGRVSPAVFAMGWDERYITAARHPVSDTLQMDRSKTEYFYVVRALDGPYVDPAVSVRGPFDAAGFAAETRRLGLPPFRKEIEQLK